MQQPPCPITGAAPLRLVQRVSPKLLRDLWRLEFGVDAGPSFKGVESFDLWESPTGLYYFDPMLEGDADFYKGYYQFLEKRGHYKAGALRGPLRIAADEIRTGERVIDVGCGYGGLRNLVPHAEYLGLDPHFSEQVAWARAETLEDHLIENEGRYDVACIFDVVEHLSNPLQMIQNMARAVKPNGRVFVSVPHVPSAVTRIPNFLLNAPPHHLTWWTESSLHAVAAQAGLEVERIIATPWCDVSSKVYWIARFSPIKTRQVFFKHSWPLHFSALVGAVLGLTVDKIVGVPKNAKDEGAGLLMLARKPA